MSDATPHPGAVSDLGKAGDRPRGTGHGSDWAPNAGSWSVRWVVERAFVHLHWFRRLRIRWEIRNDSHEALLALGCALICWRRLSSAVAR